MSAGRVQADHEKGNEEFIDQFNRQAKRRHRLQWRKLKRRMKLPKLGAFPHAIPDLRDEMREKQRPVDCISSNRSEE